jgi:hypothetical protein
MNMAIDIKQFDPIAITFMGIKKNNIINGHFSKIIYGDSLVTFNGIYIYFQIIPNYVVSFIEPDTYDVEKGGNKRKNEYSIFYLDSNNFNLNIVHQLSSIEHSIIEYYKELYKINKTSVHQLKSQLHSGNIKIYKNDIDNSGVGGSKPPASKTLQTTQTNNVATFHKPVRSTLHHYYTNTFTNMSIKEAEDSHVCKEMRNYLLKVSGIWENKFSLGITYKFIELGKCIK